MCNVAVGVGAGIEGQSIGLIVDSSGDEVGARVARGVDDVAHSPLLQVENPSAERCGVRCQLAFCCPLWNREVVRPASLQPRFMTPFSAIP
jgi:hypothetical protein